MTEETSRRLAAFEERLESNQSTGRALKLGLLHDFPVMVLERQKGFVQFGMFGGAGQFGMFGQASAASTSGGQFGQFGSFQVTREDLELPPAPAISFAAVRGPGADAAATAPSLNLDRLQALQLRALLDFLNPAGFGYVLSRDHVAGFEPHQFRHIPAEPGPASPESWAVIRLELVSLHKHDAPVVYVSDVLPSMVDAGRLETRPLTTFEEKGLNALRKGDDSAVESAGDRVRMFGGLRAAKQCQQCHAVQHGDLLGAFSWELQWQPAGDHSAP